MALGLVQRYVGTAKVEPGPIWGSGLAAQPRCSKAGVWRAQASCLAASGPGHPLPGHLGREAREGPTNWGGCRLALSQQTAGKRSPPGAHALLDLPPAAKGAT